MKAIAAAALVAVGVAGVANAQQENCTLDGFLPLGSNNGGLTGQCSSHGTCTEAGLCECSPGWVGLSDFVNLDNYDCQINELVVKLLWGLLLLITVASSIVTIPNVKRRWEQFKDLKRSHLQSGKSYSVLQNRGLLAVLAYNAICLPSVVLFAILRLADDSQRIGVTWAATILFATARFGFYLEVAAFQPALLASILHGSKKNRRRIAQIISISNVGGVVNLALSSICGLLPIVTVIDGGQRNTLALGVYYGYMGGMMLTLAFYSAQAIYLYVKVNSLLNKSYKMTQDMRILQLKAAISSTQREGTRQGLLQLFIYGLFACWPFLIGKHDYFLPIGWIGYPLISKKIAQTAVAHSTQLSSSAQSGKASSDNSKAESFRNHGSSVAQGQGAPLSSYVGTELGTPVGMHDTTSENAVQVKTSFRLDPAQASKSNSTNFRNGVSTYFEELGDDEDDKDSVV